MSGREELTDLLVRLSWHRLPADALAANLIAAGWVSPAAVAGRDAEIERMREAGRGAVTLGQHAVTERAMAERDLERLADRHVKLTRSDERLLKSVVRERDALRADRDRLLGGLGDSVGRGLAQSAAGETVSLGSFAEFLDDETAPVSGAVEGADS